MQDVNLPVILYFITFLFYGTKYVRKIGTVEKGTVKNGTDKNRTG